MLGLKRVGELEVVEVVEVVEVMGSLCPDEWDPSTYECKAETGLFNVLS